MMIAIADLDEVRSVEGNPRVGIDAETVAQYAQRLALGDVFPPILVYRVDGVLLVADGLHRLAATRQAGRDTIAAEVRDGTEVEWQEAVVLGNMKHGRPWSRAERRECVRRWLLIHPERSDNWVADDMRVSKNTVAKVRAEMEAACQIDRLDVFTGRDGKTYPREVTKAESSLPPFAWAPEGYVPPADMNESEWRACNRQFKLMGKCLENDGGTARMGAVQPRFDRGTYSRVTGVSRPLVDRYAQAMLAGCRFPPIVCLPDGGILDGVHRWEAGQQAGQEPETIIIEFPDGRPGRALALSVLLNSEHGLQLTTEDLHRNVRRWWQIHPELTAEEIARQFGIDPREVARWREGGQVSHGLDVEALRLEEIDCSTAMRKLDPAHVARLAESIGATGLLHPVIVTQSGQLVDGLHRLEAYRVLGHETIPVRVMAIDGEQIALVQCEAHVHNVRLTVLEQGEHEARREKVVAAIAAEPEIIADPEIQRLLPPLTPDELAGLEASILADGVLVPLVVWDERNVLLDGHHRLEIARKHGLPYDVERKSFADEGEARQWVMKNQLGRKNLTPDAASYLRGLLSRES